MLEAEIMLRTNTRAAMLHQECWCDLGRRILLHVMGDTLGILYSEEPAASGCPSCFEQCC